MRSRFPCYSILGVMLLAGALSACGRKASGPAAASGKAPGRFSVETITVAPTRFQETLSATGTLIANESIALQSEQTGVVREIGFQEGAKVAKGDILLKVDDSELQAHLQRAEARLALDSAQEQRQRELLARRGISRAEYDESLANLNIARAEVELIKAQIAKTVIHAPFDGVIGLRQISIGSYVTPGSPIASLQDLSALKLEFTVPERYLSDLRAGQRVEFRVAGRSEKFTGTIYAIEPSINVQTRSILVRANVPNPDERLLPGSFAEAEIILDENPNALLIPAIALIPGLRQQTVYLYKDGVVEERPIVISLRTTDSVQVVEGLAPGDEVITTGILQLRPGMPVDRKKATPSQGQT